jgi:hypothetical protein
MFQCRIYHIPSHIQYSCPHAQSHSSWEKGAKTRLKSWTFFLDEVEEKDEENQQIDLEKANTTCLEITIWDFDLSCRIIQKTRILGFPPREWNFYMSSFLWE